MNFLGKKAYKHQDFTGKIVVKYRNGKSTAEIPYYLTALEGGIAFDNQATKYFTNEKSKNSLRHLKIKNEFKTPIKILNLTMGDEVKKYFRVIKSSFFFVGFLNFSLISTDTQLQTSDVEVSRGSGGFHLGS